ncbi:hypothetical protein SKAU_G00268730 [Synaphobranchus kaupii]|uniref:Uncharacterized protein n=1 Tax=Synaphobranchus kaupii TaxID=118154 RepID=A0A9Q1IQC7_SYNKA|nr:hypothetical protein SKAU_G00268730 [Synaphobranchus kaupii]
MCSGVSRRVERSVSNEAETGGCLKQPLRTVQMLHRVRCITGARHLASSSETQLTGNIYLTPLAFGAVSKGATLASGPGVQQNCYFFTARAAENILLQRSNMLGHHGFVNNGKSRSLRFLRITMLALAVSMKHHGAHITPGFS